MSNLLRVIGLFVVLLLPLTGCNRTYVTKTTAESTGTFSESKNGSQIQRFRFTEVSDPARPGIEWEIDPPLSPEHDALQILFWSGSSHMKICKGRDGRFTLRRTSFNAPRPLEGSVFELRVDHREGDTYFTLSFLQDGAYQPAATMRVPGIRSLGGPTDVYLCWIDPV